MSATEGKSGFWERTGIPTLAALLVAAATMVGTGAFVESRHKDDVSEIAQLRSRVSELEKSKDEIGKSKDDIIRSMIDQQAHNPLAEKLALCQADNNSLKKNQNVAVIAEMRTVESDISSEDKYLRLRPLYGSGYDDSSANKDAPSDVQRAENQLAIDQKDLSAMRQKLTCAE